MESCRQKEQQVKKLGCEKKNKSHWGTERCSWRRASKGGGQEEAGALVLSGNRENCLPIFWAMGVGGGIGECQAGS